MTEMGLIPYLIACIKAKLEADKCQCFKPIPAGSDWIEAYCEHGRLGLIPWKWRR